jgi:hypothetical protein
MPKFLCSYAYDVPCYADFCVEAESEQAAKKLINEKLESGAFSGVSGEPCWENAGNDRAFVSGEAAEQGDPGVSLGELLTGSNHRNVGA